MNGSSQSRQRTALYAALAAAILGSVLFWTYVRQLKHELSGGRPVTLLALRHDVDAGRPITEEMLLPHDVPEIYVESRHVLASSLPRVLGVPTAIGLEANQVLAWTDLASTPRGDHTLSAHIPLGMRAMSLSQPERHLFGGLLRPGDRVDVLITKTASLQSKRAVTVPLLQNVLVLSVGDNLKPADSPHMPIAGSVVTLLMTMDQASLLAHARSDSRLTLVLRNEDDIEISEGLPETDDSDVLEEEKRSRRQRRIVLERVE
jgi:pilus assembly protein CpaB